MSKKLATILFAAIIVFCLAGDQSDSPNRECIETECGNEEHGPPGEANHSGGRSHHQTEACAEGREGSHGDSRKHQLGSRRLLLGW